MARRLVALVIGLLGVAITLWAPSPEQKMPLLFAFATLTGGLLVLEAVHDHAERRVATEREQETDRQRARSDEFLRRLQRQIAANHADVVGKGTLSQRAKWLSLELFEFFARRLPPLFTVAPGHVIEHEQPGDEAERAVSREAFARFDGRIQRIMQELRSRGTHDDLLETAAAKYGDHCHLINVFSNRLDEIANQLGD